MHPVIRCAIIGCGSGGAGRGGAHSIAYAHGWAIRRVSGLELTAAASRRQESLDAFAAEFPEAKGYLDYRKMLEQERPELVSVCAFPPDREEMVLAAIAHGAKGVWIEKPFAMDLRAAHRMMTVARAAGCRLFVNHQRRYGQPMEWWQGAIAGGELGELESLAIVHPPSCSLFDFGSHTVDLALFGIGTRRHPAHVMAGADFSRGKERHGFSSEFRLTGLVQFNDGLRLTVETGWSTAGVFPVLRVNGTCGFAELRMEPLEGEGGVFRKLVAGEKILSPATDEHFHHSKDPTLYVERACQDIHRALCIGIPTRIDAEEAYRGLEIILSLYASANLGRCVEFPLNHSELPGLGPVNNSCADFSHFNPMGSTVAL